MDDKQPEGFTIQVRHGGQLVIDPEKASENPEPATVEEPEKAVPETPQPAHGKRKTAAGQ